MNLRKFPGVPNQTTNFFTSQNGIQDILIKKYQKPCFNTNTLLFAQSLIALNPNILSKT